jgi:hypothetical protein
LVPQPFRLFVGNPTDQEAHPAPAVVNWLSHTFERQQVTRLDDDTIGFGYKKLQGKQLREM